MANIIKTYSNRRVRDCFVAGLIVAFAFSISSEQSQGESHTDLGIGKQHQIECPRIQPSVASGCVAEAAAYAQALVDLQAASLAADDAYNAWYACEYGGYGGKTTQSISDAPSILVRD